MAEGKQGVRERQRGRERESNRRRGFINEQKRARNKADIAWLSFDSRTKHPTVFFQ